MSIALISLIVLIVTSLSLICFVIIFFINKKIYDLRKDHRFLEVEMQKKYEHLLNNLKIISKYIEEEHLLNSSEPCIKLVKDE